jgi:predicted phage terminase large subunit-like protein
VSLVEHLDADLAQEFDSLDEANRVAILAHARWVAGAHAYQVPPPLEQDYHVWMMLAGRGAGKTRSAAEALWWWTWITPGSRALVLAPTSNDLKFTCFEGQSGLLACIPEQLIVDYNKQDHHIKLVNGSSIRGISADSYERLRGPQFHFAWCDELAAFTGKVVSRDMFRLWPAGKEFPRFEFIIQSYDCAFSEKTYNDPTAMTTWGVFKPTDGPMSVLLIDCWAEHLDFPKLKPKVLDEWRVSYGEGKNAKRPDLIIVEDKAAGISLIQELRHAHLPVIPWNPGKADKMQRLQITASIFATGRVWLPESGVKRGYVKDWCEGFLSQLCSFPDSSHDDYVDSATQAIRYLKDAGWLDINPEPRYDDEDDYFDAQPKRVNPYAV